MPGVFSRTSTLALTNLTLPYIKRIASSGFEAIKNDIEFLTGLNIHNSNIIYKKVAEDVGMIDKYTDFEI